MAIGRCGSEEKVERSWLRAMKGRKTSMIVAW